MFDTKSPAPQKQLQQIVVQSVGRLHFGLVEIAQGEPHCFGGIGLMIEPATAIIQATIVPNSIESNNSESLCRIDATDHWSVRIESILSHWRKTFGSTPIVTLSVVQAPQPHCGLGSGTQMACTVALALLAAERIRNCTKNASNLNLSIRSLLEPAAELAKDPSSDPLRERLAWLSQRGKRSNVGLSGFIEGGFIYDGGQSVSPSENEESLRTMRIPFPELWPILIVRNDASAGDFGERESELFERCSMKPNPNRSTMLKLVEQDLLPSMASQEWERFSEALGVYGQLAGQVFSPAQGGIYRTPRIAQAIELTNKLGIENATQSSWGPTVCAVARDPEHANWCVERLQSELPNASIHVTRAANRPAQVTLT